MMNYNINNENERIIIGEVGENLAESCTIDYSAWVEEYGEGNLRIRAIREGDAEPYPVANVETADGVATWTYTAADTAVKGFGEVQVLYYVGDVLAKSRVWKTYTYKSLNTSSEEVPDPYQDWLSEVERIGGQVDANAEAASASADSASASATLAAGSASEAAESALSASRSASAALGSASAASSSAESAASSATAASRSATEASNYEYYSEQYMNEAKSAKFGAESARTGAENAKAAAQASATAAAQSAAQAEETAESIEESADLIQKLMDNQIKDTATGTIASFPDGADMPMVSLVADIEPIQDTSGGAPSPSNICPISGWDSVDVSVAGKNLFDADGFFGAYGGTKQNDGSWRVSNLNSIYHKVCFENKDGYTGRFALTWIHKDNASSPNFGAYFQVVYTDGTTQNMPMTKSADAFRTETAITRADKVVDYIWIAYSSNGESYYYGQIEIGETATSYESYQGTTITTTLPQTVYGGTVDVVSGVLTVTTVMENVSDLVVSMAGTSDANKKRALITTTYQPKNVLATEVGNNLLCNVLPSKTANATYAKTEGISYGGTGKCVFAYVDSLQTVSAWETFAEDNNMVFTYELATPTTIQLTPQQIDSLLGRNNVWADSGDVTVEYIANTKLYIQKVIS